jgi:hypothetical protein
MKHYPKFDVSALPSTGNSEPTPEETLRLLRAFHRINDPMKQAKLIELLELHASKSPRFAEMLRKLQTKH